MMKAICRGVSNPAHQRATLSKPAVEARPEYVKTDFAEEKRAKAEKGFGTADEVGASGSCGITKAVGIIHGQRPLALLKTVE
jgi:hypothetical protein